MPRSLKNSNPKLEPRPSSVPSPSPGPVVVRRSSPSIGSGLVDSMVSGFGFGAGNSLARSLFEPKPSSSADPPPPKPETVLSPDDIFKKYMECLQRDEPNENCDMLLEMTRRFSSLSSSLKQKE